MPTTSALRARARLLGGFGALLALAVLLGAFALWVMGGLNERTEALAEDTVPHLAMAGHLDAEIEAYRGAQFRHLAETHAGHRAGAAGEAAALREGVDERLRSDGSASAGENDRSAVDEVESLWDRYVAITAPALEGPATPAGRERAETLLDERGERLFAALRRGLRDWAREEEDEASEALAGSVAEYRRARTLLLALLIVGATTGAALALWLLVVRPVRQFAASDRHGRRLDRALEMAGTESEAMQVIGRSLAEAVPDRTSELLLADSSQSHLRRAVASGPGAADPGCPVDAPHACPAVRRGQTTSFPSSEALDACPKLRDRGAGPMSATCIPVTVLGRAVGVVHVTGPEGAAPGDGELVRLEATAAHAGARLGVMRVMAQTQLQASTDPLTGLLNRRSLEERVHELQADGVPYALALADLDHFKRLNDTFGHETGDRALRLLARTLAATVRAEDIVARYGGEEFVVLLPRCDAETAAEVLERCRASLREVVSRAEVPEFTCSFGLADGLGRAFDTVVAAADDALFTAKRAGRDRVVRADPAASPFAAIAAISDPAAAPH